MVRVNAVLSALVALVAGERATLFPFVAPQSMKVKHELKEDAGFHKTQHYCYAFIYAVVGKGDAKALQNLPSLVAPLCRAPAADCKLYTESLLAAVEQKQLQVKLSRGSRPYADWCEQVYNRQHPEATHTTTAMPPRHHSSLRRHQATTTASQPATTTKANTAKARLPLQLAKSAAAAPTSTAQPQAGLRRAAQAVRDEAAARRKARAAATTVTTTVATTTAGLSEATPAAIEADVPAPASKAPGADKEIVSKEIKDMANDLGNFQNHFIADMTGHAIASTAARTVDKSQQLGGAEVAFDKAFAAVHRLDDGKEHSHHHWHHGSR